MEALNEKAEKEAHGLRVSQANVVLEHLCGMVIEKANKVCRYKQRLAALKAEFEAEKQAQVPEILKEFMEDPRWDDTKEEIDSLVIKAVRIALPKSVKGTGGIIPRSRADLREGDVE